MHRDVVAHETSANRPRHPLNRLCGALCLLLAVAVATGAGPLAAAPPAATASPRDGSRDFDVLVGNWKATLKRLDKPLSGSTTWTDYEGTQITTNVWGGRASLTEFSVRNRQTGATVEGLTLKACGALHRRSASFETHRPHPERSARRRGAVLLDA